MEWEWKKISDPVLHIDLTNWADIILVSPLSCNTASKFYYHLSDNTISLIFRALPYKNISNWKIINYLNKIIFGSD